MSSPRGLGRQHPAKALASNAGGGGLGKCQANAWLLQKGHHHPLHQRDQQRVPAQSHPQSKAVFVPGSPVAALSEGTGGSAQVKPPCRDWHSWIPWPALLHPRRAARALLPPGTAPSAGPGARLRESRSCRAGWGCCRYPTFREGRHPRGTQASPSSASLQLFQHLRDGRHRTGCPW